MDLPFFLLDFAVEYACESGRIAALGVGAVGAFSSGGGGGGGGAGGGGGGLLGKHISLTFFVERRTVRRSPEFRKERWCGRGGHQLKRRD